MRMKTQITDPKSVFSLRNHAKLKVDSVRQSTFLIVPEKAIKLNETASMILKACNGQNTYSEIVDSLQKEFGSFKVEDDVSEFLEDMVRKGWVVIEQRRSGR